MTYVGEVRTTESTTGSGRVASSFRFTADLSWRQGEVDYTAAVTGGYSAQPGSRTSTYRVVASGSGSDSSRVHLLEVVHARWSPGAEPEVLVEVERITCR